jgi:hypothetical protein
MPNEHDTALVNDSQLEASGGEPEESEAKNELKQSEDVDEKEEEVDEEGKKREERKGIYVQCMF